MTDFEQRGDALTGAACPNNQFAMLDLMEDFKRVQADLSRRMQARDEAMVHLFKSLDASLPMLQALAQIIDRRATDPFIKRAAELMTNELGQLESWLAHCMQVCVSGPGGE